MRLRIDRLPFFMVLNGLFACLMYVPAMHALALGETTISRHFFYSGSLILLINVLIALARGTDRAPVGTQTHLRALFLSFTVLPAILAVPFYESVGNTRFLNAYFEMVASLTTTGMTLFEGADRLPPTLHLWRGLVAWAGGLMMWIAASAVFAPLSLGGFEVTDRARRGNLEGGQAQMRQAAPMKRWQKGASVLVPVYAGLTATLWILLMVMGDPALRALVHAMSITSTSGITLGTGLAEGSSGIGGEMVMFLFLLFALSRVTFSSETGTARQDNLLVDPELRLGLMFVVLVPALLFLRHWMGAYEFAELENFTAAMRSLWGAMFTVLSFLTTTGFESAEWKTASDWSGLDTPGMILMGLAIVGGGVATTAGGVKLIRVYVLYLQGLGEMEKLVHPSVVIGTRPGRERRVHRQGAPIAWVFFMLFAVSLALITVILAGLGSDFDQALVMAIAALTTTGPLVNVADGVTVSLTALGGWEKGVICGAMVLGRLETLAIIALMSPELWRR